MHAIPGTGTFARFGDGLKRDEFEGKTSME
jgi:hypothetical protein